MKAEDKVGRCGECGQVLEGPNQFHNIDCCNSFKAGIREVMERIELQRKWQGVNGETGKLFMKGWIVPISELETLKKEKGIK